MRLITVLNRCTTFKRFVFEGSHFDRHGRVMVKDQATEKLPGRVQRLRSLVPHL